MKVLLINPSTFRSAYGEYAEAGGKNPPMGLLYLAAVLRQNNIPVEILDAEIKNLTLAETMAEIKRKRPDIIGITAVTATYLEVEILAKKIKQTLPRIPILVGGPHVTAMPEYTMKNKHFDIGFYGEGENTMIELVNYLDKVHLKLRIENLKKIDGLVLRDGRKVIKTRPRELINDLDELPFPAWDLLEDLDKYVPQVIAYKRRPVGFMITSRGCPYSCIFCDKNVFGNRYRMHSAERVVSEIEYLIKRFGVREIKFLDDQFTLHKKRLDRICDLIIKKRLNLSWSCSSRVDTVNKELFLKMRKAGCWLIAVGIESGNQRVLDFIKKGITLKQVRDSMKWAREAGIRIRGFFMLGHPTDTKESIEDTIKLALELPLNTAEFSIATPFPNTEFGRIACRYGKVDKSDISKFAHMFPVFTPKGLTREYLIKKQKEAHKRFFLRPAKVLDFLLQIRSLEDIRRYWIGFKILVLGG